MYEIIRGRKFKTSYKKLRKSGRSDFDNNELEKIISLLMIDKELPEKNHDHALKGNFLGQRECHLSGNLLLIYEIDPANKIITLAEIGTHAQVFGL